MSNPKPIQVLTDASRLNIKIAIEQLKIIDEELLKDYPGVSEIIKERIEDLTKIFNETEQ